MFSLRSRAWCFTINNDKFDDLDRMLEGTFRYLIFGFEEGDDKHTPHIQGYVYFDNARTQQSMKKYLPRAHLEISRGTPDQNEDYCNKDGDYYEFGTKPEQGKAAFDKIQDIMNNPEENFHLFNQYRRSYNEYIRNKPKDHEPVLKVIPKESLFQVAKNSEGSVCIYPSEYSGEDILFIPPYTELSSYLLNWLNGFPPKYKIGYEYAVFNPKIVCIYYSDDREKGYINKYYLDYIDHAV